CGAPNVRADMLAVWLPPSMTVPASFGDKEPFVLDTREIRGEMSSGMLAAADELALGSDHTGILEIDSTEQVPTNVAIKPGTSFAHAYGLDDYVIDIENKMFTHRPDLFGQIGIARELFAILQPTPSNDAHTETRFPSPEWYKNIPEFNQPKSLDLKVTHDAGDNVQRYTCVVMENANIGPSPLWLRCALVAMGGKPINNVVDITNYIMLMTAQPTHAYDYDKLHGKTLGVRMAKKGEEVILLNGKTYQLDTQDIVIVDGKGPVGLGGIMGGGTSEVSAATKNIVLEVATFNMYTVRKSSMRHGVFTDALARFNKGQSPLQNDRIIYQLMQMMQEFAGAMQASKVSDIQHDIDTQYGVQSLHGEIQLSTKFINERLGLTLGPKQIGNLLRYVEFASFAPNADKENELSITAPFWRTDIEIPEDIVEEVGRLYGFDNLPRELPRRSLKAAPKDPLIVTKQTIRTNLRQAGANEVLTYSFVHEKVLTNAGQDSKHAYKLSNALSPDLQYYRLSLTSSLLDKIHMNIKAGHDEFALFEINKVHFKGEMDMNDPAVPNEDNHVAMIIAKSNKKPSVGAAFYQAQIYVERVLGVPVTELMPLSAIDLTKDTWGAQLTAPYDVDRSTVIVRNNKIWGVIGEFKAEVSRAFKLPDYAAGFEIHLDIIQSSAHKTYRPLSKYPSVVQDISLKVALDIAYSEVLKVVQRVAGQKKDMHIAIQPVSIYQPTTADSKTMSFRIIATSYTRTLTDKDVNKLMLEIEKVAATIPAERI
ncbi:MAG: phenylalanine--tRNA ligase subunit beta, partial [Candidatus Saccharimonadales bacterium]